MIHGADLYPIADYYADQDGLSRTLHNRLRAIGVTSIRWNMANEFHIIRAFAEEPIQRFRVYTDGVERVGRFVEDFHYHFVLGIDVTRSAVENVKTLRQFPSLPDLIELHNEPTLDPWKDPDYYEHCVEQMAAIDQAFDGVLPFCIQFHSMAAFDRKLYEENTAAKRAAWTRADHLSPHSYGMGTIGWSPRSWAQLWKGRPRSLGDYKKFRKTLWVTEWNVFKPDHMVKRSEWLRWFLTKVQLWRFRRNKLVRGVYFHHATGYAMFERSTEQKPYRAAEAHAKSAGPQYRVWLGSD